MSEVKKSFFQTPVFFVIAGICVTALIGGGIWFWTVFNGSLVQGQITDYLARAETAVDEGNYQEAFNQLQEAINLDPTNSTYLIRQADVAFLNGDYRIANNLYRQAGITESAEMKFYSVLESISALDYTEALIRIGNIQIEESSDRPLTTKRVSYVSDEINQIDSITNLPQKKASVAKLLIEQNAPELAQTVLQELIFSEPDYRDAHYLQGVNLLKQGNVTEAKQSLQKALEIDPHYEPAKTILEQLSDIE